MKEPIDTSWHTPLKNLHLARNLFNQARADIMAKQRIEYDDDVLTHLGDRPTIGLPFPHDFSNEPDQIKQIKQFLNALYLAEQAFDKLGNLNLMRRSTYDLTLIREAYNACHLLLTLSTEIELVFRDELSNIASLLGNAIITIIQPSPSKTDATQQMSMSLSAGRTLGNAIDRMKPATEDGEVDLLTYLGLVFPMVPAHIETAKKQIQQITSKYPERALNLNEKKMTDLRDKGTALSKTIADSKQNIFFFAWNLLSLIQQMNALFGEIQQEAGHLNDTLQALVRENIALLKYTLLPAFFASVDKLEAQLLLKPGRLSKPLMEQIRPWYEILIQKASLLVAFETKGEALLKLEDSRFIELRLAPLKQRVETSEQILHQMNITIKALQHYTDEMNDEQAFREDMDDARTTLRSHLAHIKPYLAHIDAGFMQRVDVHLARDPSWYHYFADWVNHLRLRDANEDYSNLNDSMERLRQHLQQIKTNHAFILKRNQRLVDAIREHSNLVIFPYNQPENLLQLSEKEALAHRHSEPHELRYTTHQDAICITNPDDLTPDETWDVYRWYANQLSRLTQAENNCGDLLTALECRQRELNTQALQFKPNYTIGLLHDKVLHQPDCLYVQIKGFELHYEVIERSVVGCKLYLMPLAEVKEAGHRDCYVWNGHKKQLSYIAANGLIQDHIPLTDQALLTTFIAYRGKATRNPDEPHVRSFTPENIDCLITRNGGHHPGLIHRGTIPLGQLNCSLTQFKSTTELAPYLPRLFAEALERGHIHDDFRKQCINHYAAIQPYLVSAFKNDRKRMIHAFDKKVAYHLSGHFYKESASTLTSPLLFAEVSVVLLALKKRLETARMAMATRCEHYHRRIEKETFSIEPVLDAGIAHAVFSPDVAEFMPSLDPIKRLIHDSNKTLFKTKLARLHLDRYGRSHDANRIEYNPQNEDYAWFQSYLLSYPDKTPQQLDAHLMQIQGYESAQIERHKRIMDAVRKKYPLNVSSSIHLPHDALSETNAFMQLGPDYQPCLFFEVRALESHPLQLRIQNNEILYQCLHYGMPLKGAISLFKVEPALTEFDDASVVSKATLVSLLSQIYEQRTTQILAEQTVPSPDEALDLYQWYSTQQHERNLNDEPLLKKISFYKQHAEKKPMLRMDQPLGIKKLNTADRSIHLIKHQHVSAYLADLRRLIYEQHEHFNVSLKNELRLDPLLTSVPYPEVGAQNGLTQLIKSLFDMDGLALARAWFAFKAQSSPDTFVRLKQPRQVLAYKRLMNALYYIEQIMHELEKVHKNESQLPYVAHLLVSWFYVQDIMPLVNDLTTDPHLSAVYGNIASKAQFICRRLLEESSHYLEDEQQDKNTVLLQIMKVFELLPHHIALSAEAFAEMRPELHDRAHDTANKIERIMEHYSSSWPYLRLFFDLPAIEQVLKALSHNADALRINTHESVCRQVNNTNTDILNRIRLEADDFEANLGLTPGLLSNPLNDMLYEFYKGLITPLVPNVDARVQLLCTEGLNEKRIQAIEAHLERARDNMARHHASSSLMQALWDKCNHAKSELDFSELNPDYQAALPLFKTALNGAHLYVMSFHEAKTAGYTDCFVWNNERSQLFYIDSKGNPNEQTGCHLSLMSLPEGDLPYPLEHQVTQLRAFDKRLRLNRFSVEKTTLVKQGGHYFIYAKADDSTWGYTPLDSRVISKMNIDFTLTHLAVHQKFQPLYAEISEKTGLIYPIHLKNTYKLIEFITKKRKSALHSLYLNENEVKGFITSNSDLILQKNGVSIEAGCSFITMESAPTHFYGLNLPPEYMSFYVQVIGDKRQLYFINRMDSQITPLPIAATDANQDTLSRIKKNQPMLSTDFKIMTELTGHTCNASWMSDVDTLVLNQHNIKPLTSCIAHSKAYYDGLCATSQVACETLEEQLNFVKKEDSKLAEVNKNKKKALMTEYFDEKINELCQEKQGLQGFELRWLTDEIRLLKPNRLYVRIKNGTKLEYSVLNHAGIRRGTCFDLNRIDWPLNKPLLSIDELNPYLQKILTITSEKGDGHTPPHSLATDYQEALKRCLQDEQAGLVDQAIVSGSISIDDGLKDTQAAFNAQYLHSYHQLNGINTAVSDFRLYLNQAEKQHPKSREAIWFKKGILHRIDALSGESTRPVDDRIEEIRDFLKKPTILDNLMAYDGAQDGWYARLLHCVLHLMQSVGLYKPTVEKRVDALIDAIPPLDAALPSPPKSFRFFSETTREKIQSFRSETEVETPPFLPRPGGE